MQILVQRTSYNTEGNSMDKNVQGLWLYTQVWTPVSLLYLQMFTLYYPIKIEIHVQSPSYYFFWQADCEVWRLWRIQGIVEVFLDGSTGCGSVCGVTPNSNDISIGLSEKTETGRDKKGGGVFNQRTEPKVDMETEVGPPKENRW